MKNVYSRAALGAAMFLGLSVPGLHAQSCSAGSQNASITDLGVLPGSPSLGISSAKAISNAGVVVGISTAPQTPNCSGSLHAFRWSAETGMQDLGVLPNTCGSEAIAISDTGVIVGNFFNALSNPFSVALIWGLTASAPSYLDFAANLQCSGTRLPLVCFGMEASGINPSGDAVVGIIDTVSGGPSEGFTWNPDRGIQVLPEVANAYGISSSGTIACSLATAAGGNTACLRKPDGTVVHLESPDGICEALAVNDNNEATGYCSPLSGSPEVPIFWDNTGAAHSIGGTGFGFAIDSQGDVVGGNGQVSNSGFFWNTKTGFRLLSSFLPSDAGWIFNNEFGAGINDHGQIVGDGIHNGQGRAFLLTLPPCFDAGGDTDGDGLCDDWEKNGLTVNVNGTPVFLDLPAMGADPNHKDIFVQLDTVGLNAVVPQISLDVAITAFAKAPVCNPDGSTGITLHVDNGPDSKMDPVRGLTWGALSKKSFLLDVANLGTFGPNGEFPALFDVEEKLHFPAERVPVFHYAISELGPIFLADGKTPAADGVAKADVGGGFIVSPAQGSDDAYVGSVFMHELGHDLGLDHGGGDGINGKPNYFSIMNYNFTDKGLIPADPNLAPSYDYSRFGPDSSDPANRLPVLDEDHLNETTGLGTPDVPVGTNVLAYLSLRLCGPGGDPMFIEHLNGPIDWDCDAPAPDTDTDVPVDVNGDGQITMLAPYDDWAHLVYNGGRIGGLAKVPLPATRIIVEPTPDQVRKFGAFWAAQRQRDNIPPVTTASLSPQPNAAGWNNGNVTVTLASTDNEPGGSGVKQITYSATGAQGIASTTVSGSSASIVISNEGVTILSFFGTDNADNVETAKSVTIQLDKTPPSINCGTPDGQWHATDVNIACSASDAGSGLANSSDASFSLSTSVPPGTETASAATGTHSVCDVAGNCAAAGPIAGNMVDKKPPSINVSSPTVGSSYLLNQAVNASYSCADGGSGVATCSGTVASGSPIDTASVGSKTFTVNATDKVGNVAIPQSVSYSVAYSVCLLYDPTRAVQSGSTIPLKIQLCDANNADVSSSSIVVHGVSLVQVSTSASEVLQASGNANPDNDFRFDSSLGPTGGYIFNLGTKGLTTGSYLLTLMAGLDPSPHTLMFQVR